MKEVGGREEGYKAFEMLLNRKGGVTCPGTLSDLRGSFYNAQYFTFSASGPPRALASKLSWWLLLLSPVFRSLHFFLLNTSLGPHLMCTDTRGHLI